MNIFGQLLDAIENAGNRLPAPTLLFMGLSLAVLLLSWLCGVLEVSAVHPVTNEYISTVNLLSGEGLRQVLLNTVDNFTSFAPLGTVLVAMLGIGIAERSGWLAALLSRIVTMVPAAALCPAVVLAGILSSIAADTGYVVLVPLAALVFHSAGRSPLAGIAAAFAGVSAGYSANIIIGPLDVILAGISTEAIKLLYPRQAVAATANWYFIIVSTVVLTITATWVNRTLSEPRLAQTDQNTNMIQAPEASQGESKAMLYTAWCSVAILLLLLAATLPQHGILRNQATGSITASPLLSGMVVIIALWAAICGVLYGYAAGTFSRGSDVVAAMEGSMRDMAGYLVLMFFAAQFVAWFDWTNLGVILAITGAELLRAVDPGTVTLLTVFIITAATVNIFIGSASAKWALMAPVFVPMLALVGVSPEATQMAYRIGDSSTNIITPLMPYFAVVLAVARRYRHDLGVGTMIAMMLPYSVTFIVVWTLLFAAWIAAGIPLGPA